MKVKDCFTENATVDTVTLGSSAHDGRAFFSLHFVGSGWGQGATPGWDTHARDGFAKLVDGIIRACGAADLLSCKGKHVRVLRYDKTGPIVGIAHIMDDITVSFLAPDRQAEAVAASPVK